MADRRWLTACLAVALLVRGVHCLYTDAGLCALTLTPAGAQPWEDSGESDPNESGCLCKGAIPGPSCVTPCSALRSNLLSAPHAAAVLPASGCEFPGAKPARDLSLPPPLSALAVRALLASWQI
jgi:hypothetical protein